MDAPVVATFYERIGCQSGCKQVIGPFPELGAGVHLYDDGAGRETAEFFKGGHAFTRNLKRFS
jgi:hypothetical protein